jgi:serine/threonine protein kinase
MRSCERTHVQARIEVGRVLGEGAWGRVVIGRIGETPCAVKEMVAQGERASMQVRREFEIQRIVHDHPHVVRVYDVAIGPRSCSLYMEYAGSETVLQLIQERRLDERQRLAVLGQVASALVHMHSLAVAHMDVKAENIIVEDARHLHVRLADFGLACGTDETVVACGTFGYCAPEVMSHARSVRPAKADSWSFGILAVALFHGRVPFAVADARACPPFRSFVIHQHNSLTPSRSIDASYDAPAFTWGETDRCVVDSCLHLDPRRRRDMAEVRLLIPSTDAVPKTSRNASR